MGHYPAHCGHHCPYLFVIGIIVWILVSSGLLFLTWNKVIAYLARVKTVKYWQALLFIVTICVITIPCRMAHRHHHHGGGCWHHQCAHGDSDGSDEGDDEGKAATPPTKQAPSHK